MRHHAHGLGIGLRKPFADALVDGSRDVDFVEIIPENFVGRGGRAVATLRRAAERWPVLAHGVSLSLGGPDPLDRAYLVALKALLDLLEVPVYTDHLCWSSAGGYATHDLLPLPFSAEAVAHTAARIRRVADVLERPVAVENISFYAVMPGGELDEPAFVTAVCDAADCGLLLDVNNVHVNAANHGRDARADLLALPLHRTVQLHVAGHHRQGARLVDSHGAPVCDAVLALAAEALDHVGDVPVLLEWDTSIPPLDAVLDEADRLRTALAPHRGAWRASA
ncbi:MAG: DUF692 domain-containing protein [Alphaproteobacteria bacterium]|nr:DUF692 domain-containing protein [Alphaproteobacteria bacterium]